MISKMEAASEDLPPGEGVLDPRVLVPPMMAVRQRWADTGSDDDHLRNPRTSAPHTQGAANDGRSRSGMASPKLIGVISS